MKTYYTVPMPDGKIGLKAVNPFVDPAPEISDGMSPVYIDGERYYYASRASAYEVFEINNPAYPCSGFTPEKGRVYTDGEVRPEWFEKLSEETEWHPCEIDGHDPIFRSGYEQKEFFVLVQPAVPTDAIYGPGDDNYGRNKSVADMIRAAEDDGGEKERILCAAIHFDDGKEYAHQPKNINTGLVLCGWRHGCIFPQIGGLVKERQQLGIYEKEQGFLTSKNYFVSRENAAIIALNAGQIKTPIKTLYSEDLY